jgi:putative transposase
MLALTTYPSGAGAAALRRGRCSLPGQVYLVTTTTIGRRPFFSDFELAARVARTLCSPVLWRSSNLLCWTLMPDHWHAIVELSRDEELSLLMQRLKGASAHETNRHRRAVGSVWTSGYHDHALRHEEDLIGVARYVVANPVRAGLARAAGDYPFWDAVWLKEHRG